MPIHDQLRHEPCCCCCHCPGTADGQRCGGEVILFEHIDFGGCHRHIYRGEPNLNHVDDPSFNDKTTSIAVLEGNWEVYQHADYLNPYAVLGPGLYRWLPDLGIANDQISSLRPTSKLPTVRPPQPVTAHVVLFEHVDLGGRHRHVLTAEPNFNDPEDAGPCRFNDMTTSFAVLLGNWRLFRDAGYAGPMPGVFGPGIHVIPSGNHNDTLSSLQPVADPATVTPKEPLQGQAVLLDHVDFRGHHTHLFRLETNLNDLVGAVFQSGDGVTGTANDTTSSIVVRAGTWRFHIDAGPAGPSITLGPGCYRWIQDVGLANDSVSAARPV